MNKNWEISFFQPDEPGVFPIQDGIRLAVECSDERECGVILYDSRDRQMKIPFSRESRQGNLYGVQIKGEDVLTCRYQYYFGEDTMTDNYARKVIGLEKWGTGGRQKRTVCGSFLREDFDWEGDRPLQIPYEDSIIYGVNVRAFTMHKSSGVKNKGTFEGLIEKLPYLKELGITCVLLMPCYEYEERMTSPANAGQVFMKQIQETENPSDAARLNCWGFQNGYYFAPKASYCAVDSPTYSFKTMVKSFHQNGIEVMMHFYFPPEVKQLYILKVIKYWVKEYHIDGVRLSGFHIPFRLLSEESFLARTKIWCNYLPSEEMDNKRKGTRNFASDNGNYKNNIRRFLKGDEGIINDVLADQRRNPADHGVINYLADYDGFSLYDCVSYERKHNETNGEDNQDGTDYNYTWNCGIEGETRKNTVLELRLKQIKNALSFLFLSQGTPFLFSGDEFANTRNGNNNCYCQDNAMGWVKWKQTHFTDEILNYTRFLIRMRKKYRTLHQKDELKVMDTRSCGYPDISYHGTEAWRPDLSYISRITGAMLCGQYAGGEPFFYIACNMHWMPHQLALPKLPSDQAWIKISDTAQNYEDRKDEVDAVFAIEDEKTENLIQADAAVDILARSISVYRSVPVKVKKKRKKHRKEIQINKQRF